MKNIEISKEMLDNIKEKTIFGLLLFWIMIPVLQSVSMTYEFIELFDYPLMIIIGVVGTFLLIYNTYKNIKTTQNKKDIIKEMLPIIIFILYMIWTLICSILSPNKELAFKGTPYRQDGYITYITYGGFFLCAYFLKSPKLRKILLNVFTIVSVFLIIISRIPSNSITRIWIFEYNRPEYSVFAHENHYGYYLMISLMCSFGLCITEKNKILKVLYIIAYTLIGYATIYNNTFGCYLATAIILIIYGIYTIIKKNNRILALIAIIIFIILSCITTKNDKILAYDNLTTFATDIKSIITKITNVNSEVEVQTEGEPPSKEVEEEKKTQQQIEKNFEQAGTQRMKLWKYGIQFILEEPLIGYGPENLKEKYESVSIKQDRPHNLLIQLATTSGIPGMILYVTAVGIIVIRGIKNLKNENKRNYILNCSTGIFNIINVWKFHVLHISIFLYFLRISNEL